MGQHKLIENLGIKWASINVNGKEVIYEYQNSQTVIPYELWDSEIPVFETAGVCLFGKEKHATRQEWKDWLSSADRNNSDLDLDFSCNPKEFGSALRAEFNMFDQFFMVLTLNRSKDFWVLATYDTVECSGFSVNAAISSKDLTAEDAFPYLMSLFHLYYVECLIGRYAAEEEFIDAINGCDIIEGISHESQEKAREYVTELYNKIKDDDEFWKKF